MAVPKILRVEKMIPMEVPGSQKAVEVKWKAKRLKSRVAQCSLRAVPAILMVD